MRYPDTLSDPAATETRMRQKNVTMMIGIASDDPATLLAALRSGDDDFVQTAAIYIRRDKDNWNPKVWQEFGLSLSDQEYVDLFGSPRFTASWWKQYRLALALNGVPMRTVEADGTIHENGFNGPVIGHAYDPNQQLPIAPPSDVAQIFVDPTAYVPGQGGAPLPPVVAAPNNAQGQPVTAPVSQREDNGSSASSQPVQPGNVPTFNNGVQPEDFTARPLASQLPPQILLAPPAVIQALPNAMAAASVDQAVASDAAKKAADDHVAAEKKLFGVAAILGILALIFHKR